MSTIKDKKGKTNTFVGGTEEGYYEGSALTNNIARLETTLGTEKEARLEERFIWVCVVLIMFDIIAVVALNASWMFLPIFMLQLIVLIGFAKSCGVDWAEQLIGHLFYLVSKLGNERT